MVDIIFKGRRTSNNSWIYGDLIQTMSTGEYSILMFIDNVHRGEAIIKDKSVSQYIGRKDSNEAPIYEGDIIKDGGNLEWACQFDKTIPGWNFRNLITNAISSINDLIMPINIVSHVADRS